MRLVHVVDAYLVVTRLISLPDVKKTSRDVFETYKKKTKRGRFFFAFCCDDFFLFRRCLALFLTKKWDDFAITRKSPRLMRQSATYFDLHATAGAIWSRIYKDLIKFFTLNDPKSSDLVHKLLWFAKSLTLLKFINCFAQWRSVAGNIWSFGGVDRGRREVRRRWENT